MTPEELANLFRADVEDTDENDPLWSDDEVYSYMDRSLKQFARATDYFSDASTVAICQITISQGDTLVDLDPRITKIRGARLASTGRKLDIKKYDDIENDGYGTTADAYAGPSSFDFSNANWETVTGNPTCLVTDIERNKVRVTPIPTKATDTINMHVYRLPLEVITPECAEFELEEEEWQMGLMYFMKYLAYQKNDSDVYNNELSQEALSLSQEFERDVREALRRIRFSSTPKTVRYAGL